LSTEKEDKPIANRFWPGFEIYAQALVDAETPEDRIARMNEVHVHTEDEPLVLPGSDAWGNRPNGPAN